jgi:8-oxo-dGTP pyrophosphatase MutT (NUDIX family)
MFQLSQEITDIVYLFKAKDGKVGKRYLERAKEGLFTRDENPRSHFCVYFLPYDPKTKQVFMVHHKKSGLWLSPGGHIDKGENLLQALNREIMEELGMKEFFLTLPDPFLLTITSIKTPKYPCEEHLDIWFLVETDGSDFNVDPKEFHNTKWLPISEAEKLDTDGANLEALAIIESK